MLRVSKKAVLVGMAALLIAGSLTAAPKKMSKNEKAEFKALQKQFKDYKVQKDPKTGKPYDFGGMKIRLADYWSPSNGVSTEKTHTQSEEDTKKFRKFICYTYNLDFDQIGIGNWDQHPQAVSNFCFVGGDENYLFFVDNRSIASGLKAGMFYDLKKFTNVDWTAEKWAKSTFELCSKKGGVYACRHIPPEPRGGLYFNKRLLREANIDPDSIYDMQANGTWTWDSFEKALKATTRDIDNDGVIDVYGMASGSVDFATLAVQSNGSTFIGKDENGKYFSQVGADKTTEAMLWVQRMVQNYEKPMPEGANWDWMYACFKNGETAFCCHQAYFAKELEENLDDYGFVAFPLGPNSDGKYKTLFNDNYIVLPACYDMERAEKIIKAFDLWSDITPGYSIDTWKDEWYPRFRDERAVDETMQMMYENGEANLIHMISGINQLGDYIWNVYPGYWTPQEGYETTKNSYEALINEQNR
ncbi:MAG: extracellular solute-binding protein [Treponema sp.]|nr:extracellular solute-binding protein [Treponema sp.]